MMSSDQNFQKFEQLLVSLMADRNDVRKEAEKIFQQFVEQQPDGVIHALLAVSRQSQDETVRQLAVTYIRSLVDLKEKFFSKLSGNTVALLKQELFQAFEVEQNYKVRRYISDAISTLASTLFTEDKGDPLSRWPELLDILLRFTKSPVAEHRQNALLILGPLSPLLRELLQKRFNEVIHVLLASLTDPQSIQVKIEALNTMVYLILVMKDAKYRRELQKLVPAMLEVIASALNARSEKDANTAIQAFADIVELDPLFLRPHIGTVVDAMFKISAAEILTNSTRQVAIEVLVSLAENKPGLCRNLNGFAKTILEILLKLMLEVPEIPLDEWNKQTDGESVDEDDNSSVAQSFLDRICIALGGKTVVPVVFQHIPSMVQSNDWRHRFTALMCIALIGEGACDVLKPYIKSIIGLIVPLFADPNPRVRWAAVNAAGQMSTDFAPIIQKEFYDVILPRIISLLDDKANPRVQRHAAAASINFFEHFDKDKCPPYLGPFLSKILEMLHCGIRDTQEEALTALAAAADCAQEHFIPYYETFVPLLKDILARANTHDYRMLRAKAVETISLIGIAVGKQKFAADAKEVMEILQKIYANPLDADDPLREYGLRAYARICQCLGQDFVPFMPLVIPSLMASASIEPELKIFPINQVSTEELLEEEEEGWQFTPISNKFVGVRTAMLDEKATAVNMILCYIKELQEGFFPWLDSVTKLLVPLMEFYYHDGVRSAALSCMGYLVQCAAKYVEKNNGDRRLVKEIFDFIFNKLLSTLPNEIVPEITAIGTSAIHECIDAAGEGIISDGQIKDTLQVIRTLTENVEKRLKKRSAKKKEDDTVDDEERQLLDEEDTKDQEILMEIADVIGILARQGKASFLPYFQEWASKAMELIQPEQHHALRQLGLCMFDDVIEHGGPGAFRYLPQVVPYMMNYMGDVDPQVRQAAVYGIGVVADKAREHFTSLVGESIKKLLAVIKAPESRTGDNAAPTENAISSLGKILFFHSQAVPENEFSHLLFEWVNFLPVVEDKIEAPHVHRLLCDFIESERYNSRVFGQNYQNLPKILSIFAHVFGSDLIDSKTGERIITILKKMQQAFPAAALQQAISILPTEQQKKLQQLFTTT